MKYIIPSIILFVIAIGVFIYFYMDKSPNFDEEIDDLYKSKGDIEMIDYNTLESLKDKILLVGVDKDEHKRREYFYPFNLYSSYYNNGRYYNFRPYYGRYFGYSYYKKPYGYHRFYYPYRNYAKYTRQGCRWYRHYGDYYLICH